MGKISRKRTTYHLSAVNTDNREAADSGKASANYAQQLNKSIELIPLQQPEVNIFKGLHINVKKLACRLPPEADQCSVISSRSKVSKATGGVDKKLTKKEKQKMRHVSFVQRVAQIQTARAEEKKAKQRRKTAIVGDLRPLSEALPSLSDFSQVSPNRGSSISMIKQRPTEKFKRRQEQMLEDINLFRRILEDPTYQANPDRAILEHLQNKIKLE